MHSTCKELDETPHTILLIQLRPRSSFLPKAQLELLHIIMLLGQMLFSLLVSGALASPRRVDISVVIDDNEVKNIAL